jgi:hypothetical protein
MCGIHTNACEIHDIYMCHSYVTYNPIIVGFTAT